MNYRFTFYSLLQGFSRKRRYYDEKEDLQDSLSACRDNNHGTVAIVFQAVIDVVDSTKPKKNIQGFQMNREEN